MKIFAVGAGKNIGYLSSLRKYISAPVIRNVEPFLDFLSAGHSVVFFLRSPGAFDKDTAIQPYVQSGHATILKGDVLDADSVTTAWKAANEGAEIDLVLYTVGMSPCPCLLRFRHSHNRRVGGTPVFNLRKGLVISPPNLTTHGLSDVLQTIASTHGSEGHMPRLIAVTSTGVTKVSHDNLPFGLKLFYSYALQSPHADKLGMERLLQHAMGRKWEEEAEPSEEVLQPGWERNYPPFGWLPETVIVRPALLTNGDAVVKYKVSTEEFASYTISRRDTAHFIGTRLLPE
jgi:hypothetical protein